MNRWKVSYADAISYHARRVRACCIMLMFMLPALAGCQSPLLVFPGSGLEGQEATTETFAFAAEFSTLELEVNPPAPYSVILRTTVIEEQLYIDAAPARRWGKYLSEDPKVRIRLGKTIYPAKAVEVTDPAITGVFRPGRTVYRMVPVNTGAGNSIR